MQAFAAAANNASTSVTINVGTGPSRYLFGITASDTSYASAASYASVAMTSLTTITVGGFLVTVWGLRNPVSGSNSLTTTGLSGTLTCSGAAYTGVGKIQTAQNDTGSGTPYSKSITTPANAWLLFVTLNDNNTASASTGSTSRQSGSGIPVDIFDSNGQLSVGSHSMAVTQATAPAWASTLIPFMPQGADRMFNLF